MKKIIFFTLISLLSLSFTAQADEIEYIYNLIDKCKKTKNRKICHKTIKVMLTKLPKYDRGVDKKAWPLAPTYGHIASMLRVPCGDYHCSWKKEACELEYYYIKKKRSLSKIDRRR